MEIPLVLARLLVAASGRLSAVALAAGAVGAVVGVLVGLAGGRRTIAGVLWRPLTAASALALAALALAATFRRTAFAVFVLRIVVARIVAGVVALTTT